MKASISIFWEVMDGNEDVPRPEERDSHLFQLNGEFENECRVGETQRTCKRLLAPKEHR